MLKKLMISLVLTCSFAQMPALAEAAKSSNNIQALQTLVENGDLNAQTFLAMRYIDGDGVEKDMEKGVALLRDAAEKGNPLAQLGIGIAYVIGNKGVSKDLEQARIWLNKAAAQGNPMAAEVLAEIKDLK